MEINDVLPRSQLLVKELSEGLNAGNCDLEGIEKRILSFVHELALTLERQGLQEIKEPTQDNSLRVGGRTAVYAETESTVSHTVRWHAGAGTALLQVP
jgi:hypothetical protein